jgi:hypothetical protein
MPSTLPLGRGPLAGPSKPTSAYRATPRIPQEQEKKTEPPPAPAEVSVTTVERDEDAAEVTDAADAGTSSPDLSEVAGVYDGSDETRYVLDGAPERTEKDPNARTRVDFAEHAVSFTLVDSSNGNDICTLRGVEGPAAVTIEPEQECFSQQSVAMSTKGVVKKGTATFAGSKLTLSLELDFELHASDQALSGKVHYRFEGQRQ